MFQSKPKQPAPKPTWAVQILTRDYMIEGLLQPPGDEGAAYFAALLQRLKNEINLHSPLWLVDARVQPTGHLTAPAQSFAKWAMLLGTNLLAIAPADVESQAAMRKQYSNSKFSYPASLFIGPYQVRARVLAEIQLGWSQLDMFVPVADATIDCLLPGARLTGWQVPWLMLNGAAMQGHGRQPD